MNAIPEKCLFHFVVLLPAQANPNRFFAEVKARLPGVKVEGEGWHLVNGPRDYAWGTLVDGGYSWRVVIDLAAMPDSAWRPGFGDAPPPAHAAHAFVFLLAAPEAASGLDRVRASLELGRAWAQAGAVALAFPAAGVVNEGPAMCALEPASLEPDAAAALLIAFAMMGRGTDGRTWLRTRGMSQFGLPDLCCTMPMLPQMPTGMVESAQSLFGLVAPYMIALDRPVQPRERIKIGDTAWRVAEESALRSAPGHYGSLRLLEKVAADDPS